MTERRVDTETRQVLDRIFEKFDTHRDEVLQRITILESRMPTQPCRYFESHEADHAKMCDRRFIRECIGMLVSGVSGVVIGALSMMRILG